MAGNPEGAPPPRPRRCPPLPMTWPSCWPPFWPIALGPGPGRAPGPPTSPTPAAGCPGCGGWCGFIENGAYEGRLFPTPNDAPRRFPALILGGLGAGCLRRPAITAARPACRTVRSRAACRRSARKQSVPDGQQATGNNGGSNGGNRGLGCGNGQRRSDQDHRSRECCRPQQGLCLKKCSSIATRTATAGHSPSATRTATAAGSFSTSIPSATRPRAKPAPFCLPRGDVGIPICCATTTTRLGIPDRKSWC